MKLFVHWHLYTQYYSLSAMGLACIVVEYNLISLSGLKLLSTDSLSIKSKASHPKMTLPNTVYRPFKWFYFE
jgi:hypothetical protein